MSVIKEEVNFQRCLEAGDMPCRGPAGNTRVRQEAEGVRKMSPRAPSAVSGEGTGWQAEQG